MKIKLYSFYNYFGLQKPKYIEWTKDYAEVEAYHDEFIKEALKSNKVKIAIITEPRCVWKVLYQLDIEKFLKEHYDIFNYIFTFDEELLKIPNALPISFPNVWEYNDIPKTKNISMACSNKSMCEGHIRRKELALQLQNKVDVLGDYLGPRRATTKEIFAEYKYSICLENEKSKYFFNERILNAFANKTIPIYYGSPIVLKLFNPNGIIYVENLEDISDIIDNLDVNDYYNKIEAINDNFNRVKDYEIFEDYLYKKYKNELEGLWKY